MFRCVSVAPFDPVVVHQVTDDQLDVVRPQPTDHPLNLFSFVGQVYQGEHLGPEAEQAARVLAIARADFEHPRDGRSGEAGNQFLEEIRAVIAAVAVQMTPHPGR